jgi:hypothetical protein
MDRRYFLLSALGLTALPLAESIPTCIPKAIASIPRTQRPARGEQRLVEPPVRLVQPPQASPRRTQSSFRVACATWTG